MDINSYQCLASRTECDQEKARRRIVDNEIGIRLNHAAIGLASEAGEILRAVEKWIYYGQKLDMLHVEEELGDCLWYLAQACNAIGVGMAQVMERNIAKLRARYPEKYSDEQAAESGRDREAELQAMLRSNHSNAELMERITRKETGNAEGK